MEPSAEAFGEVMDELYEVSGSTFLKLMIWLYLATTSVSRNFARCVRR